MQRIFAHQIIYRGAAYRNHVAQLCDTSGCVTLFPFTGEIHSTRFIPGTVEITVEQGRLMARRVPVSHTSISPL